MTGFFFTESILILLAKIAFLISLPCHFLIALTLKMFNYIWNYLAAQTVCIQKVKTRFSTHWANSCVAAAVVLDIYINWSHNGNVTLHRWLCFHSMLIVRQWFIICEFYILELLRFLWDHKGEGLCKTAHYAGELWVSHRAGVQNAIFFSWRQA